MPSGYLLGNVSSGKTDESIEDLLHCNEVMDPCVPGTYQRRNLEKFGEV